MNTAEAPAQIKAVATAFGGEPKMENLFRVLMAHNYYQIKGGEDVSAEAEERLLRDMGHSVHFLTKDNHTLSNRATVRDAFKCTWSSSAKREVSWILHRRDVDILHVQNFFPQLSPSVYYAAAHAGIPVVQTLRNYRLLCPKGTLFRDGQICENCVGRRLAYPGIAHGCYRNSRSATAAVAAMASVHRALATWETTVTVFVALSAFARAKMIQGGLSADKIVVKPNFVHPDPGLELGKSNFALYVGRLSPEKGIDTLLQAWDRLSYPLKIIGAGELLPDVLAAASKNRWIEYLGERSLNETYEFLGNAAVVVVPSVGFETFGRVAIEAFAKGTPVVASNRGALPEVVEHDDTGRLFSAGKSDDLAAHVEYLVVNPKYRRQMGLRARSVFESRYTARNNYKDLLEIYRKAQRIATS